MPSHRVLGLVPLDQVDSGILRDLRRVLADLLPLTVKVMQSQPLPRQTHHAGRDQYHSTQLLEYLLKNYPSEPFRVLGITAVDLYIPIFTFVFGEAQLDGKAAVISTFRPGGGPEGVRPLRAVFLDRVVKLGLHELGHTFALGHCRQPGCLMGFSATLEKLDQKELELCKYCRILLADYLQNNER